MRNDIQLPCLWITKFVNNFEHFNDDGQYIPGQKGMRLVDSIQKWSVLSSEVATTLQNTQSRKEKEINVSLAQDRTTVCELQKQ